MASGADFHCFYKGKCLHFLACIISFCELFAQVCTWYIAKKPCNIMKNPYKSSTTVTGECSHSRIPNDWWTYTLNFSTEEFCSCQF